MKSDIRINVGDEFVGKLLEKHPEAEVQILDAIIKNTATRIIKKALNGSEPTDLVLAELNKAVAQVCSEIGFTKKKSSYESVTVSPEFHKRIKDSMELEAWRMLREKIAELLKDEKNVLYFIGPTIKELVKQEVTALVPSINATAEAAVKQAIKDKLGV